MAPHFTHAELLEELTYYPGTGFFTRRVHRASNARKGSIAGTTRSTGYRIIDIMGSKVYAHRLAWFYVTGEWPPSPIDHINGLKGDNRWHNLRLATISENGCNSKKRRTNTSGTKGVSSFRNNQGDLRWAARVYMNGKCKATSHKTKEEAIAAIPAMREAMHGQFARHA